MTIYINSKYDENQSIGTALTSGLLGMWHLDEDTGNYAYDASGKGYTGTLQNSPSWVAGKYGYAIQLVAASTQYIKGVGEPFSFPDTTFSVCFWFQTTAASGAPFAQDGCESTGAGWYTNISGGTISILFKPSTTSFYTSTGGYNDGKWHNVVVVGTTSTTVAANCNAIFYVDGSLVATSGSQSTAYNPATLPWTIGARGDGSVPFNGIIDEARIYNRGLSVTEVTQLYNEGAPNVVLGNATDIADIVPLNGAIGIWHLDEGTGTSTYDASKYARTGTLVHTPTWVTGRFGKALQFVTASNQYVSFSDSNLPTGSAARSMFAWVYLTAYPPAGNPAVFGYGTYGTNHSVYLLLYGSGALQFYADGNDWGTAATVPLNTWTLVGFTYTAGATTVTIYIGSTGYTGSLSGGIALNTTLTGTGMIGTDPSSDPFGGTIDEVRFYNRALSAAEVAQLASEGAQTGDYVVESYVDLTNMVSGDSSTITEYVSADGVNSEIYKQDILTGALTAPVYRFHSKLTNKSQLYRVTLDQTVGTGKSYPVTSIMQVMSS